MYGCVCARLHGYMGVSVNGCSEGYMHVVSVCAGRGACMGYVCLNRLTPSSSPPTYIPPPPPPHTRTRHHAIPHTRHIHTHAHTPTPHAHTYIHIHTPSLSQVQCSVGLHILMAAVSGGRISLVPWYPGWSVGLLMNK